MRTSTPVTFSNCRMVALASFSPRPAALASSKRCSTAVPIGNGTPYSLPKDSARSASFSARLILNPGSKLPRKTVCGHLSSRVLLLPELVVTTSHSFLALIPALTPSTKPSALILLQVLRIYLQIHQK